MDNTSYLTTLSKNFTSENLITFLRAASGSFRQEPEDYGRYLETATVVKGLFKLGVIKFVDEQRLVVLVGRVDTELTSQSGKQRQYELAKKVLKDLLYDAGI